MVNKFEFSKDVDYFPLQNSRLSFSNKGGLMRTLKLSRAHT